MQTNILADVNFHYHALSYLNVWTEHDERFCKNIERATNLAEAASYYAVSRNLKTIQEKPRLSSALGELEKIEQPENKDDAIRGTIKLADALGRIYGRRAVSAASKFLWLRFKRPLILYDSRALKALNETRDAKHKIEDGDYSSYYEAWLGLYTDCASQIREACLELLRVKKFTLRAAQPNAEFSQLIQNDWFHERVFDSFLWLREPKAAGLQLESQGLTSQPIPSELSASPGEGSH